MSESKPTITVDGVEQTAQATWEGHGLIITDPEVAEPTAELEAEAAA